MEISGPGVENGKGVDQLIVNFSRLFPGEYAVSVCIDDEPFLLACD
jgi:hypothetical protein